MNNDKHQNDGPALAAIVAAGIGCAVIGFMTVLVEAFGPIKEAMKWWEPAGPLSGKTGMGVVVWLVSWIFFHILWRNRELTFQKIWLLTLLLIAVGWIGTFPPIFEMFAKH